MQKNISLWVLSSWLALGLMTGACSYFKRAPVEVMEEAEFEGLVEDCDSECPYFRPEEFRAALTKQYELQGHLLNDAMVAILNDQEFVDLAINNLNDNTHEIAAVLGTVYGSRVAEQIELLLNCQNQLLLDYLDALKAQNKVLAKEYLRQSYANGHLLMEFINIMNPFFAYRPETYMMDEHVTLESDQAQAYLQGDIERAEELKQRSIKQMEEMALHLAGAIETQMTEPL